MGFPTQVNTVPAYAVAGDFASTNPRATALSIPGGHVAGAGGLTIGTFAWADSTGRVLNNYGAGMPTGFVPRRQQAVTPTINAEGTMVVNAGFGAYVFDSGDFYVTNAGSVAATYGMKAYVSFTNGAVSFNATGTPPTAASVTGAIATNTVTGAIALNSATGSFSGTTLTVTAIGAGTVLGAGLLVSGTGVDSATTIVKQLTGTAGGVGTYQVSVSQTLASGSLTFTGSGLTVSAVTTGALYVGQVITSGAAAGTTILALGTGTGGTGTYVVSIAQTVSSGTLVGSGSLLTVSAVGSGALAPYQTISGSGVTTGTYILSQLTGTTGGTGTYLVSASQTASSTTITVAAGIETKFVVQMGGAVGELVKITSHSL